MANRLRNLTLALAVLWVLGFTVPKAQAQQAFTRPALTATVVVQTSLTHFYGYYVYNPNASTCSLDLFSTATPTLGTTLPYASFVIPATGGANLWIPGGVVTGNALSVAAVTTPGGASTCGTGMTVNLWYQ